MALTDQQQFELNTYGKILIGDETSLELSKLERKQYLKHKFRPKLEAAIGDYGDNITDATRAIVLGQAILLGIVTDEDIINGYKVYIQTLLGGYGGAESILNTLSITASGLQQELVASYYVACTQLVLAETEEDVRKVDLLGEPAMENFEDAN